MTTVCIDFDGVIHSYVSGWQGADVVSDPIVDGAIGFMLNCLNAGYTVAIFSSRSHQKGGLSAMTTWLRKEAGNTWYDSPGGPGLENVKFPKEKPSAIIYIDDRGYYFTGKFPPIEFIKSFKTWQGK